MKIFKAEDALMDRASKTITMLVAIGTLGFGIYAYYNTIHPVFEKEKELQSLRAAKLTLKSENDILTANNTSLKTEFATSKKDLSALNDKLSKTNFIITEKQIILDKMNRDLARAKKYTVLSKLELIREKLINTAIYEMITKRNIEFDIISYSKTLLPNDTDKISASEQQAYSIFKEYINSHNGKQIEKTDDIIKYAIMLPYLYRIKENILSDND